MNSSIETYRVLEGTELGGGWTVGPIRDPVPGATGGTFSVQFDVQNADGRVAFCKVLDLVVASQPPMVAEKLEAAAKAFNYEADIVRICGEYGARRVVYALHSGEVQHDLVPLKLVKFIIFERAENDVRSYLDKGLASQMSSRFRALRHVALGIRELHGMHIAHQDLKPSNVLMFDGTEDDLLETKIADLGRASRDGVSAVHDVSNVAGAYAYSPPELLYGQVAIDFYERRQSCDLYQMGCLIAFVLAATSVNDEWNSLLSPGQVWRVWGGTYADIYPTIRRAMDDVFDLVESRLDGSIRDEVGRLVRDLCDPDPRTRGSRLRAASRNPRLVLTRLVTRLDVLEKRAEIKNLMVA